MNFFVSYPEKKWHEREPLVVNQFDWKRDGKSRRRPLDRDLWNKLANHSSSKENVGGLRNWGSFIPRNWLKLTGSETFMMEKIGYWTRFTIVFTPSVSSPSWQQKPIAYFLHSAQKEGLLFHTHGNPIKWSKRYPLFRPFLVAHKKPVFSFLPRLCGLVYGWA